MSDNHEVFNTEQGWNDPYHKKFIISLAEDSVRQERISICESCDKFKLYFCTDCGCYLPFKTRIKDSVCTLRKW